MKKIIFLLPFCLVAAISFAQKETFDLITFIPPKGWAKNMEETLVNYTITDNKTKSWCRISVIKSTTSKGTIEADFESEWQELVVKNFQPIDAPQLNDVVEADGWKIKTGVTKFRFSNADAVAMLTTISGFDHCVSILTTTNTQVYKKVIETFLASISLKKLAIPEQNNNGINSQTTGSLTNYVWKSHQNRKDPMGNNAGYSTNSYQFYSNGTYKFSNTTFQYYTPKYYMVNEEGTYQINGNKITLKPVKSKYEVRQLKKTDPVSKSGNISLEAVEYSFEYTTIYDRLRLVLAPSNKKETKRDGGFNYYANGEKTKSYLYDAE